MLQIWPVQESNKKLCFFSDIGFCWLSNNCWSIMLSHIDSFQMKLSFKMQLLDTCKKDLKSKHQNQPWVNPFKNLPQHLSSDPISPLLLQNSGLGVDVSDKTRRPFTKRDCLKGCILWSRRMHLNPTCKSKSNPKIFILLEYAIPAPPLPVVTLSKG